MAHLRSAPLIILHSSRDLVFQPLFPILHHWVRNIVGDAAPFVVAPDSSTQGTLEAWLATSGWAHVPVSAIVCLELGLQYNTGDPGASRWLPGALID